MLAGAVEAGAVEDAGDFVGQIFTGFQVADAQCEALIANPVDGVDEQLAVGGNIERADCEEAAVTGFSVEVDELFFAVQSNTRFDAGWGPAVSVAHWDTAVGRVVLPLRGAGEVPMVAAAGGN